MVNGKYIAGLITAVAILITPAAAETIIGRWRDQPVQSMPQLNSVIAIVITDSDELEARIAIADSSKTVRKLTEVSSTLYRVTDSRHEDSYRIVNSTGDLQLIDNDGLIRTVSRLENTPKPKECGF